jgi:hypothetical protein
MRVLLILLATAATVWALVECIQADEDRIRRLPKIGWILVILFAFFLGALAWFIYGRPRSEQPSRPGWGVTRRTGGRGGSDSRRPAPDDDPEFLQRLSRESEREQMLRRWEEDLRRREQENQGPDEEPEPPEPGSPPR